MTDTRILQFIGKLGSGGIETVMMNIFENIGSYTFDFVVNRDIQEFYDDKLKKLGGKKIVINNGKYKNKYIRVFSQIREFAYIIRHGSWSIVHFHVSYPGQNFYYMLIAKICRKKIVIHIHSIKRENNIRKRISNYIGKFLFNIIADSKLACSEESGEWCFGKRRYEVIYNGIVTSKFIFSEQQREKKRKEMGFDNQTYIIGTVGRMSLEKNHSYLIDVCKKLLDKVQNFKIVLVGDGELKEDLLKKIKLEGVENWFLFAGTTYHVESYLSAFDLFVLPSIREAFPLSLIEAQTNGLSIISSSIITPEVQINDSFDSIPLENIDDWVTRIYEYMTTKLPRECNQKLIEKFDIKETAAALSRVYRTLL